MKSNHEKLLMPFSNIEHHVVSQLVKSEIKTQLLYEEKTKYNQEEIGQMKQFGEVKGA